MKCKNDKNGLLKGMGGLLGFLLCFALTNSLCAAEWFVAKGGSDSNAGTAQAPFLTIQRAVDAAGAGDTVRVGEGVFADGEWSVSSAFPSLPSTLITDC